MTNEPLKATQPLPCPFCGGDAVFWETHARHWQIGCVKCGIRHPLVSAREIDPRSSLTTAWNTRAPSHHDLIEALRGLLDEVGKSACADAILDSAAAGKAFAVIAETEGRRG